jgi:IS30 family transposase
MEPYHQLTREQRYQIRALLRTGQRPAEIARVIGVHRSTISRELRRNTGLLGYQPAEAQARTRARRHTGHGRIAPPVWAQVERLLRQDWSPEQISGRLKREGAASISHEWIYQYVLRDKRSGGELYRHLRYRKKYHKRYGYDDRRRKKLPNARSIDERPAVVEARSRLGDWEVDTMSGRGRRGGLLTLTERKSRFTLLERLSKRNPQQTERAVCHLLGPLPGTLHTLTSDRGNEFQLHKRIEQRLGLTYYFAHAHAAWERGTNENTNGLLRQYFPKQRNLLTVSSSEVRHAQQRLNLRPRKCLDFQTPFEVFFHLTVALGT